MSDKKDLRFSKRKNVLNVDGGPQCSRQRRPVDFKIHQVLTLGAFSRREAALPPPIYQEATAAASLSLSVGEKS